MEPKAIGNTNFTFKPSGFAQEFKGDNSSPSVNGLNSCFGSKDFLSVTGAANAKNKNSIFS